MKYTVTDCEFNRKHYKGDIGKTSNKPISYARVTIDNDRKYRSFYGSFTVQEAIKHLGHDHVQYLVDNENWHMEINKRIMGAWHANNGASHKAYCALMQAGQGIIEYYL